MFLSGLLNHKHSSFQNLGFSSDHHCHLLPGVDDGVQSVEDTVRILHDMKQSGITSVTLTPHVNPDIFHENTEEYLRGRYALLLQILPEDIASCMRLNLAAEYMVVDGFENRDTGSLLKFDGDKVLIEMSYYYQSRTMPETIFHLMMEGVTPVIAHPERYLYLADHLTVFDKWHDMGAGYQLNLLSLSGIYGSGSVRIMEYLLRRGMYVMAGTDTHSPAHFQKILDISYPQKYGEYLQFCTL